MEAFGPGLKTTGFPQPERLYAFSSLSNSTLRVNTCVLTNSSMPQEPWDTVCKKLEQAPNFKPIISATPF